MAVGVVLDFPAPTTAGFDLQAGYEHVGEVVNDGQPLRTLSDWGPGLLAHAAGPTPDGGWVVVEVWESQEAADTWKEQLMPILGPMVEESGSEPRIQTFSVYRLAE